MSDYCQIGPMTVTVVTDHQEGFLVALSAMRPGVRIRSEEVPSEVYVAPGSAVEPSAGTRAVSSNLPRPTVAAVRSIRAPRRPRAIRNARVSRAGGAKPD